MHIKILRHGAGSCKNACDYVARKPKDGEQVTTLRGNPDQVAGLADSLGYKYKYTSAVIAWHPEDKPTAQEIAAVLDDFERVAFAGLSPDQYTMLAVQHTEKDGTPHIHIITPRHDMGNNKSMNIAPPGWQRTFDPIRDLHNAKNNWKSPDIEANPENARTTQLGLNRGSRKELAQDIDAFVVDGIEANEIKDRKSLVAALEKSGLQVTKQGKDFITIMDPSDNTMKKGMRLKGDIYAKDFDRLQVLESGLGAEKRGAKNRAKQSLGELAEDVNKAVERRAEYNAKRHPIPQPKANQTNELEGSAPSLDSYRLPSVLPDYLRSGVANNQAPAGAGHPSADGLPSSANSKPNNINMQPKKLENGQAKQHYSTTEMTAEMILKLIENLARLFGYNVNLGGVKNDGNRTKSDGVVERARETNARVSDTLRTIKQQRDDANESPGEPNRSVEQIERDTNKADDAAKRAAGEFGQVIASFAQQIKAKREQEQQQQNDSMEIK